MRWTHQEIRWDAKQQLPHAPPEKYILDPEKMEGVVSRVMRAVVRDDMLVDSWLQAPKELGPGELAPRQRLVGFAKAPQKILRAIRP